MKLLKMFESNIPVVCSPEVVWKRVAGRYMNMIINFPAVLIGAYYSSCRAGKYGYDGWLGCG